MRSRLFRDCAVVALAVLACAPSAAELADLSRVPAAPARERKLSDAFRTRARLSRVLHIDSSPSGARASISYLRDGVELARAERTAPFDARIPGAAFAGDRDRVVVRVELVGHAPRELAMAARTATDQRISLAPLPARLLSASLLELGDRAELRLASDRALNVRVAPGTRGDRLIIADLTFDAASSEVLGALGGASIRRVVASRLGTDVAIEIERAPALARHDLRVVSAEGAAGGAHRLLAQWVPPDEGAAARAAATRALAALEPRDVGGCALAFERELRAALGSEDLARAFGDERSFARSFVAPALERLAALAPRGELRLVDETRLRFEQPLERAAALARASEVHGALTALRAVASSLAPPGRRDHALGAWLAPERGDLSALSRAAGAEMRCAAAN